MLKTQTKARLQRTQQIKNMTKEQQYKWKSIKGSDVIKIAHRCSKGVNFAGSSKSDVIRSFFCKNNFCNVNKELFCKVMDAAADKIAHLNENHNKCVSQAIDKSFEEVKNSVDI